MVEWGGAGLGWADINGSSGLEGMWCEMRAWASTKHVPLHLSFQLQHQLCSGLAY